MGNGGSGSQVDERFFRDSVKPEALIKAAIEEHNDQVHHIPLHHQFSSWATRSNVEAVHRADNFVEYSWIKINK